MKTKNQCRISEALFIILEMFGGNVFMRKIKGLKKKPTNFDFPCKI